MLIGYDVVVQGGSRPMNKGAGVGKALSQQELLAIAPEDLRNWIFRTSVHLGASQRGMVNSAISEAGMIKNEIERRMRLHVFSDDVGIALLNELEYALNRAGWNIDQVSAPAGPTPVTPVPDPYEEKKAAFTKALGMVPANRLPRRDAYLVNDHATMKAAAAQRMIGAPPGWDDTPGTYVLDKQENQRLQAMRKAAAEMVPTGGIPGNPQSGDGEAKTVSLLAIAKAFGIDVSDLDLNKFSQADSAFFVPITKVEKQADGSRVVCGYASTPRIDLDGESVALSAIKNALPSYMEWAPIRQMHQPVPVGKATEAHVDETGLFVSANIIDENAIRLLDARVLQGFSIGGRKLSKSGNTITDLELVEISLVDRPANPDCRIEVAKAARRG